MDIREQLRNIIEDNLSNTPVGGKSLFSYLKLNGFVMERGEWYFDDSNECVSDDVVSLVFNEGQIRIKNLVCDLINKIDASVLLDEKITL